MKKFLICLLCLGCIETPLKSKSPPNKTMSSEDVMIETVYHDNHSYIVAHRADGLSILHNPGCSCKEEK